MDQAAQMASKFDWEVLKEPRGFIKLLEFILAIFAFATTTSFSSYSKFTTQCDGTGPLITNQVNFSYPFRVSSGNVLPILCNNATDSGTWSPYGDFSSSAEFYVFVGVMAFLYSIGALVLYICFDEKYRSMDLIPQADFIVTSVFTALWLISSSAWAQGVTDLKFYTNPDKMFVDRCPDCVSDSGNSCKATAGGNFASLNVSLIFGYLNMFIWAANLWFLFKETTWFKVRQAPPQGGPQDQQVPSPEPQAYPPAYPQQL